MIFIVKLTYTVPKERLGAHLESHKQWLFEGIASGKILAAGPAEDGKGGFVIAHCADRDALAALLAGDAFLVAGVATASVDAFNPQLHAQLWPAHWR